ncbi:50S ribosomal protein L29 [Candidatus Woesebacteria bacterium RIFCSPLOWO2_01_FULL_43_11]|uniref:Large ribosomal subunit protein uL29 n=1 Tax=Candidatus Woesebacteria bacterium RBG_16_42_24 TaxID=1802485 RepID=A0A1F7XNT6_9BACT|nr:MAG: 50S ribosomal protein L29 [Candidatus Woesebacteria bacterium RBG_16_42_24]OGM66833.1 MAG: 50S ribosomal protein L29 [Candidatus Woesebacteria bacterium RIFCSPLOWO2_01_FULL_43_11]
MKKKDKEVIRTKDIGEVKKTLAERKAELKKVIAEVYGGKEKNLKKAKNLRREIAQILTILREREILDVEAKKE